MSYCLSIRGRVQGVGYRYWLANRAETLRISGWVANNADGTVTAYIQGEEERLKRLIKECEEGPRMAMVEAVEAQAKSETTQSPYPFRIK